MRDYEAIIVERRGPVAVLTLNRPDKLNALSGHLRAEVAEALAALRADDHIRALVVTGAGRGFCSGVDLTGDTPLATGRGIADELVEAAVAYAGEMAQWPPLAVRMAKRVLQHNVDVDLEEALRFETLGLAFAQRAPNDAKESRAAFVEKRKGAYTGT